MPLYTCFWKIRNSTKIGMIVISTPAQMYVVLVSVRARKFIEGGENGLQILVPQIQVGHVVLVVNTHTFQYQRSHDGHGAGQTNLLLLWFRPDGFNDYEISTGSHGTVGDNVRRLEGA